MNFKICNIFAFCICIFLPLYSIDTLNHFERLECLKERGFKPKIIYDIGAFRGKWSSWINGLFNDAQFFMFEANEYNRSYLESKGYPYFIVLLGDHIGSAMFYTRDGNSGDSILREQTYLYEPGKCREELRDMTTLEKIVQEHNLPLPDLVKIDVQGAEKMIIEGGKDIICNAEIVIMETKILQYNENAPLACEIMTFMDKIGYNLLDIVELHYDWSGKTNQLFEVDFLFVKRESSLFPKGILVKDPQNKSRYF